LSDTIIKEKTMYYNENEKKCRDCKYYRSESQRYGTCFEVPKREYGASADDDACNRFEESY